MYTSTSGCGIPNAVLQTLAKGNASPGADARILNTALGAELEAIAAYQGGAESGLLQKPVLELAVTFQIITSSTRTCWRRPSRRWAANRWSRKAKYMFPSETLKSQADVLPFATTLEKVAVSAYLGAVPLCADRDLAKGRGRHRRRPGDALGGIAAGTGQGAGAVGLRRWSAMGVVASIALAPVTGGRERSVRWCESPGRSTQRRDDVFALPRLPCVRLRSHRTEVLRPAWPPCRWRRRVRRFAGDEVLGDRVEHSHRSIASVESVAMIPGTSMGHAGRDRCEGTRRPDRVSRSREGVACVRTVSAARLLRRITTRRPCFGLWCRPRPSPRPCVEQASSLVPAGSRSRCSSRGPNTVADRNTPAGSR